MHTRIQKYIAEAGITSRRKAEILIAQGKVKINGAINRTLGTKIDPTKDLVEVCVENKWHTIELSDPSLVYIALNKPVGYITSTVDTQGASIMELLQKDNYIGKEVPPALPRIFPVGRLDKDSEGLILLTNDGELTNALTHPSQEHEKEYEVTIDQYLTKDAIHILTKGMVIDDTFVRGITILEELHKGKRSIVRVILTEGKNRQIRKMFGAIGYQVTALKRVRIGKLKLGVLPIGKWKLVAKHSIV